MGKARDDDAAATVELRLQISGGPADTGEIDLEEYRISLEGWQHLIELASRIYFLGYRADPSGRGRSPFNLQVRAPERGSVLTDIILRLQNPVDWGVVGTQTLALAALYDILKSQTPRFFKWVADLSNAHVQAKRRDANIDVLVANLRSMVESPTLPANELQIPQQSAAAEDQVLFDEDERTPHESTGHSEDNAKKRESEWLRRVIESVDVALEQASRPIDSGCTGVDLAETQRKKTATSITIGIEDREALLKPIALPEETEDWERARVKFRRIDTESGSVLFRFEDRPTDNGNHFGYILDSLYLRRHNPYTQALDGKEAVPVWVRREITEHGGVRYAIRQSRPQKQLTLHEAQ